MNLLESKLNSIAAIAIDASLNSARLDYVNENFYNKSFVISALNNKQSSIVEAPATVSLGQPADYTYFIDSTSVSYPLFNSKDIIWTKFNNNISFNISNEFKNTYLTTTAASLIYARADELSNFETTTSMLNSVYQSITGMSSYVTTGSLTAYQPVANMATYITSGSLTTYVTSGSLTAYQPVADMLNYVTSGSLTVYQPVANMVNYVTSGSLTAYQPVVDMATYVTSGSLTAYQTISNMSTYVTSGSLVAYVTSGSLTAYQPIAGMSNYLTGNQGQLLISTSGGGIVTWNNGYLLWSARILVSTNLVVSTNGYYNIDCPTSGTIARDNTLTVTCTAAGIPLDNWQSLYYILPTTPATFTSLPANFMVVSLGYPSFTPQWNWILIAINNADNGLHWCPNRVTFPINLATSSLSYDTRNGTFSWLAPVNNPIFTGVPKLTIGSLNYDLITQPWVGGWFQFSSMTVQKQIGLHNFSVVRSAGFAAGSFDISFPSHPAGGSYMIIFTPRLSSGAPVLYGYGGVINATGFTVRFTNISGTFIDAEFSLFIPRN